MPTVSSSLSGVGVLECCDRDPRPTFILDLEDLDGGSADCLNAAYNNLSSKHNPALLSLASGVNQSFSGVKEVEFGE